MKQPSMHTSNSNHLLGEKSLYLQQHAKNPVDWHPWSAEIFEQAKRENKLVLISIGYSSCHWCHVMENESFVDSATAKIMNDNFICIKVDREERPDIDQIYMKAVQIMTGSGGWPLNCFTLPDGKPIYGGTYFPNATWKDLLTRLSQFYRETPAQAYKYAEELTQGIHQPEFAATLESQTAFNKDILNPVENRGKYVTEAQRAINLGVYGADLAYISCYNNPQMSRTYFDAVGKLSAEMGVLDNIDKKLVERFVNNVENGDSLLALNADFYRAGDRYLKNNANTKTAVLILLGGWAESLHLAIQSSGTNAAIRQRIGEQKDAAASLAKLIGSMNDTTLDAVKKSLADLSVAFAELKSTYEYKQPIVDAQEHKTYLTSRTIIAMDDSQLAEIASLVSQLRTNIIQ